MASPRNPTLKAGVSRFSRSQMQHRTGRWAVKNKKTEKKPKAAAPKTTRSSRFYPTEDVKKPLPHTPKVRPARVRQSLTPGTIVILLAGRYKGQRAVFLKALPSGLLLVTGPYAINGVPLRRVNQAYVIATSTKLDISGVKIDDKFTDSYFARPAKTTKKSSEFFADEDKKKEIDPARKADQKAVDDALIPLVKKVENLKAYLASKFSLSKGVYPHELVF